MLLGAGQLVRAWSLWLVVVAAIVLVAVALTERDVRRPALVALVVSLGLAVVVPSPWYVHQATRYSNPVFDRPQENRFLLARRPVEFYVDARYPAIVFHPWQGQFNDRFIPVLYAETWGDYFGIWAWGPGRSDRTDAIDSTLVRQSALGLLPTALALVGLIALLGLGGHAPTGGRGQARRRASAARSRRIGPVPRRRVSDERRRHDQGHVCASSGAGVRAVLRIRRGRPRIAHRIVGVVLGVALAATALALLPFLVW